MADCPDLLLWVRRTRCAIASAPDTEEFSHLLSGDSHLRGFYDCPYSGQSIHADRLDEQVAALIQSLKLTATREEDVRKLLHDEQDRPDPETERKEIRSMLRLMRDNYERGLYEVKNTSTGKR